MKRIIQVTLSMTLATTLVSTAPAAEPFYLGTWKISSGPVAPWWQETQKPDPAESKSLVGKTFVIARSAITGPRQVACKGSRFEVKNTPADLLFQGMLEKVPDQTRALAALGFKGKVWKTLITNCENELELHFIDDRTTTFGLNNYVYIAQKQ